MPRSAWGRNRASCRNQGFYTGCGLLGGGAGGQRSRIRTITHVQEKFVRKPMVVNSVEWSKCLGQWPRPDGDSHDAFQPLRSENTLAPNSGNGVWTLVI